MKKILLAFATLCSINTYAQVDKFVAVAGAYNQPVYNFTFKEAVSGQTRSLHTPLNQGKFVVGYYGAYWCGICHDQVLAYMNSTIIKKWLADYPGRIEFWADIYDGNNATTAQSKIDKTWGNEVFAFYAGNDLNNTPFSCNNNPGYLIIEPSTKKLVHMNNSDPTEMFSVLKQLLEGKYQNPNLINNLALRKKVTTPTPNDEGKPFVPEALTDGLDGTKFQSGSQEGLEFTLDLGGMANIKEMVMKSDFNSGINFKLSVSNNEKGPWKQVSSVGIPTNRELYTLSNMNENGRYIKFQRDFGKIEINEFIVRGTMENTTGVEDITLENFELFPNPSNGIVNITLPAAVSEINVLDVVGKVVYQQFNTAQKVGVEKLDLSALEKGIYFVKIKGAKTLMKKVVIE